MEDQKNIPNEEQTGRLQQPAVRGSVFSEVEAIGMKPYKCAECGSQEFDVTVEGLCQGCFSMADGSL